MATPQAPHARDAAWVARTMDVDAQRGLSQEEAARRLRAAGPNELARDKPPSAWRILGRQFANVLIVILLVAIVLSALLDHRVEAVAIAVITAFTVGLGFAQEAKAERAMDALRRLSAPHARVLRDGTAQTIDARDVVPGDVFLVAAGDLVPADGRLLEANDLSCAEASLTGESVPVDKDSAAAVAEGAALGDRTTMVFATTSVTRGRARAVAVATGSGTEVGKIGRLLAGVEKVQTPLEIQLQRFGRWLVYAATAVVALIVATGLLRGEPLVDMVLFGIALAVAVVPEALPAVVTISLALGAQRMARRNALVRRLSAVETLGSTTVICTDKTGTLTTGQMTVSDVAVAGQRLRVTGAGYSAEGSFEPAPEGPVADALRQLLEASCLCNDAQLLDGAPGEPAIQGDPTEAALVVAAAKAGMDKADLEAARPRVREIGFTSERKRMTTVHQGPDGLVAYSKGAPEVVLPACTHVRTVDGESPLDERGRRALLEEAHAMAVGGSRVLAVAMRRAPGADPEQHMVFLGLLGLRDPPRHEAEDAIATCHAAGIRPVLVTGDHAATAATIARELGILRGGRAVSGPELERMDDRALAMEAEGIDVYARVTPEHKLRIVAALQANGEVVAMTGDGVNDAPALRKAQIGVAMGITGTDVAKQAASMTLADDNFATIVAAVEEGRGIFDNVRKYLVYLLSTNFGEVALVAGALLLGFPLPLTAVQILYVNLASDGLPALALAVDPHERDVMRRPPRDTSKGILDRHILTLMLLGGLWSAVVNISVFWWALGSGRPVEEAMTMTFVSLVLIQFVKAYVFRTERTSVFRRPFANRWLNLAIAWEVALLLAIVYVPAVRGLFGTFALTAVDWAVVGLAALSIIPVMEPAKWLSHRASRPRPARAPAAG